MVAASVWVARAQAAANIAGGLWSLLHRRSFEKVFGPKSDEWLMYTVGGLLVTSGWAQLAAAGTPPARRLGVGIAATLLTVDLVYVAAGRLRPTYLFDAAMEATWIAAWTAAATQHRRPTRQTPARPATRLRIR